MIIKLNKLLIATQILLVDTLGNLQRTIWRICILILGCTELTELHTTLHSVRSGLKKQRPRTSKMICHKEFPFITFYRYFPLRYEYIIAWVLTQET